MPTFYEVDSTRATAREHWWGCRGSPIAFAIVMLMKWLRRRTPMASDDANVDSTLPFVVESLSGEMSSHFEPLATQMKDCGFLDPVYYSICDPASGIRIYWATFRHESGQHLARIHNRYWDRAAKPERALFPLFFTTFTDSSILLSSSGRPDTAAPPEIKMNRRPGAKTPALWAGHLQMVGALSQTKAIQSIRSQTEIIQESERVHALQRDFHLKRGFFRERTARENSTAEMLTRRIDEQRALGAHHPEIVAEIARIEDQKPHASQAVWLLLLSLLAFICLGASQWKWETTLWLIPILFFHEFGHWVAMKIFGYRNMRMFFIPLFGAAVSGQNRTIPGWKKAIVSLAGPLPGILLGSFLCGVSMLDGIPWMRRCGLLFVVLNVFNLIPILPLDGGRFLQLILFCRNRWMDILFRGLAIAGLIGLTVEGGGRALAYVAVALAMSLPLAFKIGRITDRFKREPLPPPTPDEVHIPLPIAETLIAAVKEVLPKAGNRIVAQNVLNIYETLNARPPSAPATFGLLGLYGGGIVISAICFYALILTSQGSLSKFAKNIRTIPRQDVSQATVESWHGINPTPSHQLLVTTLRNPLEARPEFEAATRALPSNATALLFGESVLVDLPAGDEAESHKWFDRFSGKSTNTFIATNDWVEVGLSFIAPNLSVATNLEQELTGYFRVRGLNLIPPWDPLTLSPKFDSKKQARKAWDRILEQTTKVAVDKFQADLLSMAPHMDERTAEQTNRMNALRKRTLPIQDQERARLAIEYSGTPYLCLVQWNGQLAHLDLTNHIDRAVILSNVSEKLGRAAPGSHSDVASRAKVTRNDLAVRVASMSLSAPEKNLPEIIDWLTRQDCGPIRYRLDSK